MIEDARLLPDGATIQSDICIVGAGVAGITLALEFIGQRFDVCLLESGGFEPDGATQALAAGENIGLPYFPLDDARPRCFGGSSYNWLLSMGNGQTGIQGRPLDPVDFEKRSWVPYSGWPFGREQLEPFYQRAHSICSTSEYIYDADKWIDDKSMKALAFTSDTVKTVLYQFLPTKEIFLHQYRARIDEATNIRAYLNVTVLEIETDASGRNVYRLSAASTDSKRLWATAKVFVLALGGIETPRLLLLSRKHHPSGLGNENDLVGRFFMEHPHLLSGIFTTSSPDVTGSTGLYLPHTTEKGTAYGRLALTDAVTRRERILNWSVQIRHGFWPLSVRVGMRKIYSLVRLAGKSMLEGNLEECRRHAGSLPPFILNEWTPAIIRSILGRLRRLLVEQMRLSRGGATFILQHMSEQAPNPSSRVLLSERLDRFGQQRVQLNWQLSPLDIKTMTRSQEILDRELRAAGLGRLEIQMKDNEVPKGVSGGWHHMGTTRMHRNKRYGVVDENCRVHDISNLYIAGPSTFPTSGYANPTLTIVALVVRLADHIKHVLSNHMPYFQYRR